VFRYPLQSQPMSFLTIGAADVAFDLVDLLLQEYLVRDAQIVDVLNYKAGDQGQHWIIDNTHNFPQSKSRT